MKNIFDATTGARLVMQLVAFVTLCMLQLAVVVPAAHAASACIANNANLYATLGAIQDNTEPTTLNLEEGTYQVGDIYVIFKSPITFVGGFKPGTLCAQHEENPNKTIIDFGGSPNNVQFDQPRGSSGGSISFADLTLRNGDTLELWSGAEADPPYLGQHDHPGTIVLSHVRVTNFHWLRLGTYYGHVNVNDSQFDHFAGGTCAITMNPFDDSVAVFNHVTMDLTGSRNLCLNWSTNSSATWKYTFANSIIWASDGTLAAVNGLNDDLENYGLQNDVTFDHTLFKSYLGKGQLTVLNQISSDPQWVDPASGDYHLKYPPQTLSPAINAGANVANVPEPATDIAGGLRKIGSNTDLGAYESPYSDASVFTVTNASDCGTAGCGSLRDAITQAEASAAPAVTINFNIAGGCPAVITLNSTLPDIIKPTTIDGYTQPNSAVNTDPLAFNAKLCIVVQPINSTTPYYGLRVPDPSNGSLTLRGIGVGAFSAALELQGGANHQITGNQFGGYIDNYGFQLYGSPVEAIYMAAANGQISIGGPDPASRNAFLNVYSYTPILARAIYIGAAVNGKPGACQIIGNTFGIQDDGTFASINLNYGIYLQGSNCLISGNTIVGVTEDAIYIDAAYGGGNGNVVQSNTIGLAPRGNLAGTNYGAGVRISDGVHNVVGSSTAGADLANANVIWNMDGGGVIVTGQNAYGNTIRANWIQDNGLGHLGMSIDLGDDGPTINDVCDCDTGPNDRQNFPTLHSISWPATPGVGTSNQTVVVSGLLRTFPGSYYQVDVYYSDGCDSAGKGIAQQWIGSNEFIGLPAQVYAVPFQAQVEIPVYVPGYGAISATATNNINGEGSTSELSACLPIDTIFRDRYDGGYGLD